MKQFNSPELHQQIETMMREKGKTCVSLVMPLHHLSFDQKADKLHLEKMIQDSADLLVLNYSTEAAKLISKLKILHSELVFNSGIKGLGLYVSENVSSIELFPFPVSEKLTVGIRFDLRDLLLKQQESIPYLILHLFEKGARLYTGSLNEVWEVKDADFPVVFETDYEYTTSAPGTSYSGYAHVKSYEKDPATIKKTRLHNFVQQIDSIIHNYLSNDPLIILCGDRQLTAAFINRTKHGNKIVSVINGSYDYFDQEDFSTMSWPVLKTYIIEQMLDEISELDEKVAEGLAVHGISNVWDAAYEGRGKTLLLEKDYGNDEKNASFRNNEIIKDHIISVNELIEIVIEKKGKILFVEKGMLEKHGRIALITRY